MTTEHVTRDGCRNAVANMVEALTQLDTLNNALLAERDALRAACKALVNSLGAHGPCRNNDCRDCDKAFKQGLAALNFNPEPKNAETK